MWLLLHHSLHSTHIHWKDTHIVKKRKVHARARTMHWHSLHRRAPPRLEPPEDTCHNNHVPELRNVRSTTTSRDAQNYHFANESCRWCPHVNRKTTALKLTTVTHLTSILLAFEPTTPLNQLECSLPKKNESGRLVLDTTDRVFFGRGQQQLNVPISKLQVGRVQQLCNLTNFACKKGFPWIMNMEL